MEAANHGLDVSYRGSANAANPCPPIAIRIVRLSGPIGSNGSKTSNLQDHRAMLGQLRTMSV